MNTISTTMGSRIEQARGDKGWTVRQLATRIAVKPATLESWERDRSAPRANKLVTLAGLLNVPVMWLLEGESNDAAKPETQLFSETATIAQKLERATAMQHELAALLIDLSADVTRLQKELDAEQDLAA